MKMRTTIVFLCLALSTALADESYVPPVYPYEVAAVLRPVLPEGWTCKGDHISSLVICRRDQVTLFNPVNRAAKAKSETFDDYHRKHGRQTDYMIVLVFRPRLTDDQFAKLVTARDDAVKKIENAPNPNDWKWDRARQEAESHFIPEYFNAKCSIYVQRTDPPFLEIYPKEAADDRDRILNLLSKWLTKYKDHNKAPDATR